MLPASKSFMPRFGAALFFIAWSCAGRLEPDRAIGVAFRP